MSRYTGPKARLVRRHGVNLFGTEKYNKILAKKNYPPGAHGKGRFSKPSEYGKQLLEKQKARSIYGITERQFRNYYLKAAAQKEVATGEMLMRLLELRVDNVIYRAGLANTRPQARQFVSHGLFLVNGRRVKTPSITVRPGDTIEVRANNSQSPIFEHILQAKPVIPEWLKVDPKALKLEVVSTPGAGQFENFVEPQLIVEYYSK